jgi:hypothetical protein
MKMFRFLTRILAVIAASVALSDMTFAGLIGSQEFTNPNTNSIVPDGTTVDLNTVPAFTTLVWDADANTHTGAFIDLTASPANKVFDAPLTLTLGSAYTAGNANFGTFTGTVTTLFDIAGSSFINVTAKGTFTFGTDYSGGQALQTAPAIFLLSFTQSGGPDSSISGTATLSTLPAVIPEPGSFVIFGSCLAGLLGFRKRFLSAA